MRSFTNFDNVSVVHPDIQLSVTANDSSQIFTFGRNAINFMSDVKWEMPFFGGIAKSLNYDIELLLGLDQIKNILRFLPGGLSELKITINSNEFYPHIGRVRGIQRDTPDTLKLTIFDRFFDSKLFFPKELITDSFDTPHLEELLSGQPIYYGKHIRPFYHTAITSDVSQLIGARNISSENHVNSTWFNSNMSQGVNQDSFDHILLVNNDWEQQSGSTNIVSGSRFEIRDVDVNDVRLYNYSPHSPNIIALPHGDTETIEPNEGFVKVSSQFINVNVAEVSLQPISLPFLEVEKVRGSLTLVRTDAQGANQRMQIILFISSDDGLGESFIHDKNDGAGPNEYITIFSYDNRNPTNSSNPQFFSDMFNGGKNVVFDGRFFSGANIATMTCSMIFFASLKSEAYKEFSIFSPIVESSDIAISENPFAIIDDIASNHLLIEYLQNQSSDSQIDVQSFNFQCFFKERQEVKKIFDDFGRITQVNMWVGDSGILNFRTFKEDNNEIVNTSLDLSDIETINITEAPIGSSVFEQDLSSKIKVKYNFDFQKNEFQNTKIADRNNNPECNSLDARDITNEIERETEYILEEDTASYYLGNLVRKFARGSEFINITGGVNLFPMELGDVFHLQHPMLINSVGNYQIIKLNANYLSGKINITAGKLDG